jgi:hypothetical protein
MALVMGELVLCPSSTRKYKTGLLLFNKLSITEVLPSQTLNLKLLGTATTGLNWC